MFRKLRRKYRELKVRREQRLIDAHLEHYFKLKKLQYGKVVVHADSIVRVSRECFFRMDGTLEINASWFADVQRRYKSEFRLAEHSTLICNGDLRLYQGASVYVAPNAVLELKGNQVIMNTNSTMNCFCHIEIGDDCGIGDNVKIADSDHHSINGNNPTAPIVIGNHVLICSNAMICAGVTIGDGAVVAAGAVVVNDVPAHCLVGGVPARVLKENMEWK